MAFFVGLFSNCRECLIDIGDDVFDILQTDGETDHSAFDTSGNKLFIRELPMGFAGRMKHAGADIRDMHFI